MNDTDTELPPPENVWFVAACGDYVRVHLAPGISWLVNVPLSVLADRWRDAGFVRVHRTYLIPLGRVVDLSFLPGHRAAVTVRSASKAVELPVSRRQLKTLRAQLLAHQTPNPHTPEWSPA